MTNGAGIGEGILDTFSKVYEFLIGTLRAYSAVAYNTEDLFMKHLSSLVFASALLTLVSCGNDSSSSNAPEKSNLALMENGTYEARMLSLNEHLAGDTHGRMKMVVLGDSLETEIKVYGSVANTAHFQSIHLMDSCPTMSLDANNDGIIDGAEGAKAYGAIALKLDTADKSFPVANGAGDYTYRSSRSLSSLVNEGLLKSGINFKGKQIVIFGIPETVELPESVSGHFGLSKHAALPIACGTIIKVSDGDPYTGGKY